MKGQTNQGIDAGENDNGFEPAQVGVGEESSEESEKVRRTHPIAHVSCCFGE